MNLEHYDEFKCFCCEVILESLSDYNSKDLGSKCPMTFVFLCIHVVGLHRHHQGH